MYTSLSTVLRLLWKHSVPGHILSRIYNCTKTGNRPIDNATNAHFTTAHFDLQLHKLSSTPCYNTLCSVRTCLSWLTIKEEQAGLFVTVRAGTAYQHLFPRQEKNYFLGVNK